MARFDSNIFLEGARQSAQSNRDLLNTLQGVAQSYAEDKRLKEAKLDAERQAATKLAMDPKQILLLKAQGQPTTAEQDAALQVYNQMRMSEQIAGPYSAPVSKYTPVGTPLLQGGVPTGPSREVLQPPMELMPQQAPTEYPPTQQAPVTREQFEASKAEMPSQAVAGTEVGATPFGKKLSFQKDIEFQSSKMLENIKSGKAKALTAKQQGSSQFVLNRMNEINEELNSLGEISSEEQGALGRLGASIAGTGVGQATEKVTDPKAQALRDEYTKLQATFLPFYASSVGLGAKSIDSEGERKAILGSFGDPTGIYESNRNQLENLSKLIGTGGQEKQRTFKTEDGRTLSTPKPLSEYSDAELQQMLQGM